MQIVIDIPENEYQNILLTGKASFCVVNAIEAGTPLPQGHGKLKDVDKIISDGRSKGFCDWYDEMKYADTIIEADRKGKDASID